MSESVLKNQQMKNQNTKSKKNSNKKPRVKLGSNMLNGMNYA